MHLLPSRGSGPAWPADKFPEHLKAAHERLLQRMLSRIGPEGSIRDACHSRALESGLALKLMDRMGMLERRPALVLFLESCLGSDDPTERALAQYALHGGPKPGDEEVARFLSDAPEFTSTRKRSFLQAILTVFGTEHSGAPPPVAPSLEGLHIWAAVQVTAARVILADAMGRYDLVSDADVRFLLDTQHPAHVWESHLLIHLLTLHALARLPRTSSIVRAGVEKVMAHQRKDGGLPFIPDENIWCTVTGAVALAASGAPAEDLARVAGYLVENQQPAGGWAYGEQVRQTDVDCTSVALEFLQCLRDPRLDSTIQRGIRSLYTVRSADGGFPTYIPGGQSEACMTAAALNALAPRWQEHEKTIIAGLDFLVDQQRADGSFPPDWSKSRFHALFRVLLAASRYPNYRPFRVRHMVDRAFELLKTTQNVDGGWGQQAGSESDPISTSYGIIAACCQVDPTPAVRAVRFLLSSQLEDGSIPSTPDSLGPRPFTFKIPILSDIFALLSLGHVKDRFPQANDGKKRPAITTNEQRPFFPRPAELQSFWRTVR